MHGWLRLWILISLLWVAGIAIVGYFIYEDARTKDSKPIYKGMLVQELRPNQQAYFLKSDSNGIDLFAEDLAPSFETTLRYTDGTEERIQFPLLKETDFQEIKEEVHGLAKTQGKEISPAEYDRFEILVRVNNRLALEAKRALDQLYIEAEGVNRSKDALQLILASSLLPPIAVLLLGWGIAWVRRGF